MSVVGSTQKKTQQTLPVGTRLIAPVGAGWMWGEDPCGTLSGGQVCPYRLIPTMLTLLAGLLITLQLMLPATALASSNRIATSSAPPKDLAFARAEVSVVRFVVSYSGGGSGVTQCTGLGVLVGSWTLNSAGTGPYTNWVLTDAALLNQTRPTCAPTLQLFIASIDVYANTAYTNNAPNVQPLGTLSCQGPCNISTIGTTGDYIAVNAGGAMLFSFTSPWPQPFVDIAAPNATPHLTIQLTDATGASPQLPPVPITSNQAQNFLTPASPHTAKPTLEPGTPTVDMRGAVVDVGIQTGTGVSQVPVAQVSTLLQGLSPQPATSRINPLQDNWNKGIDALFGVGGPQNLKAATNDFGTAGANNSMFQAATAFEQQAQRGQSPIPHPTVGTGPTVVPTATTITTSYPSLFGIPSPLLVIGGVVLLALIVLLVVVPPMVRPRARRRELERFEMERQEAEKEAQRQQQAQAQAQAAQVAPPVNIGSTPRPTSLPCSNCRQLVRVDAPSCPYCHYLLTPSPSGKLLTARPPTMAETPPRALNTPAPSTPELSIPQLQHVLPLQQSAALAHSPATTTHAPTASDLLCPNCGRSTQVGATYCPNCRYRLSSANAERSDGVGTLSEARFNSFASPGPGGADSLQSQKALVEATPGNASVEARLRRLWSQLG